MNAAANAWNGRPAGIRLDAGFVELDKERYRYAAQTGLERELRSLADGHKPAYGNSGEDSWTDAIEGAGGECAGCLFYGLHWNDAPVKSPRDVNNRKMADSLEGVEFRTTTCWKGRLITHPDDADDRPFVSMVGRLPRYYIQGWLWGHETKRKAWWEDPKKTNRWAFFSPTEALRPMASLDPR